MKNKSQRVKLHRVLICLPRLRMDIRYLYYAKKDAASLHSMTAKILNNYNNECNIAFIAIASYACGHTYIHT